MTSFPAEVRRVERVVPRVVRVTVGGDDLRALPDPTPGGHLRLFFGEEEPEGEAARYLRRTLTPRWFDRAAGEVVVELVVHGEGVASDWATRARPGDAVVVSGPGGRYRPEAPAGRFVLAVDDTAVPAAGTVVEALGPEVDVLVLAEVTDAEDERPISPDREVAVEWLHRAATGAGPGELLEERVAGLPDDLVAGAGWFVAAEARTVRRLHHHLVDDRGANPDHVEARGYWRLR